MTRTAACWMSVLLLIACGQPGVLIARVDGPAEPQAAQPPEPRQPGSTIHTAFSFTPRYVERPFILERPVKLNGTLTLEVLDGARVKGTLSFASFGALAPLGSNVTTIAAVSGMVEGDLVVLDQASVGVTPGGSLRWSSFRLNLDPSATGELKGSWRRAMSDVVDQSEVSGTISAQADVTGEGALLEAVATRQSFDILPTDVLRVRFNEPVALEAALAQAKVLVGGAVCRGTWSLEGPAVNGRVVALRFKPDSFLPFDAPLSLSLNGLADPAGNLLTTTASTRQTVADPGSLTANQGFEQGLTGWAPMGLKVEVGEAFQGLQPAEGSKQLLLYEESAASAYLDVPATASELSLSVALFSEHGQFDRNRSAVIKLHGASGDPVTVFDAFEDKASDAACNCGPLGHLLSRRVKTVDLTPFRGQRVFLVAEARSAFFIGVNFYVLAIDDLQVK